MIVANKRAWLAERLEQAGILRLLERAARRPGLLTLVYHRIGDPNSDPFYRPMISATPEAFRTQMRRLAGAFRVIRLDDLSTMIHGDRLEVREPTALVTFDDGYRDNLTLAVPILRELRLPAAFFVTTGFVEQDAPVLPWWDRAAYACQHSRKAGPQSAALDAVIQPFFERGDYPREHAEQEAFEREHGIAAQDRDAAAAGLFLSRAEVMTLAGQGFDIGAHTVSHDRLVELDDGRLRAELIDPRETLASWIGRPITAVAYPYGRRGAHFDDRTTVAAREAGYRLGFALDPRPARPGPIDPLALPRFAVSPGDRPALLRARLALASAIGHGVL